MEASLWCFENVFSSLRVSSSSHSLLKVEKDQVKGSLRLSSIEGEALRLVLLAGDSNLEVLGCLSAELSSSDFGTGHCFLLR